MKCSVCGKEFGEGVACQNCGVDRVTGLANYSSYGTSDYHGTNTSHYDSSFNSSPNTMVCYSCGEIIPANSEYCPYCSKELYVTCPKCGKKYSSQFPACNKCGTNRNDYYEREKKKSEEKERKQREWEQSPERVSLLARKTQKDNKRKRKEMFVKILGGILALLGIMLILFTEEIMLPIALIVSGLFIIFYEKLD